MGVVVSHPGRWRPPAPQPRVKPLGPIALIGALWKNPLEAWTHAHFEQPMVIANLVMGQATVVSAPAAVRRVLLDNAANYQKDTLQRRMMSAALTHGLLMAEGEQWRTQRRALAPMFARRTVLSFAPAMAQAAASLVRRWYGDEDGAVRDVAADVTLLTLDVLERTIFSEGLGGDPQEVRAAMRRYFDIIGRIEPFDLLGLPDFVPRLGRIKARPALLFFDRAVDNIIATRRGRLAEDTANIPDDILTLLLKAQDPETGRPMSEAEVRANIITFIAAGHETTANTISWSLFLLSQSPHWQERVVTEAEREIDGSADGPSNVSSRPRAVIGGPSVSIGRLPLSAGPRSRLTNFQGAASNRARWWSSLPTCSIAIGCCGSGPTSSIRIVSWVLPATAPIGLPTCHSASARASASVRALRFFKRRGLSWRP